MIAKINNQLIPEEPYVNMIMKRAVNPPFLAERLSVLEVVSLSPYFTKILPVFENNQFSNIKVIVYANYMRKIVCFHLLTFCQFWAQLEIYW